MISSPREIIPLSSSVLQLCLLLFFSSLSISNSFAPCGSLLSSSRLVAHPNLWNTDQSITPLWITTHHRFVVQESPPYESSSVKSRLDRKASYQNHEYDNRGSRISVSRAGGRSRNVLNRPLNKTNKGWPQQVSTWTKRLLPFFLVMLFLRWMLSPLLYFSSPISSTFPSSSPSYVYYQKSIYESSSYNSDNGKVERTRRESFRSNIPSFMSGQQIQENQNLLQQDKSLDDSGTRKSISSSFMYEEEPDDVFERELEMFFPRNLFDDFF